MKNIKVLVTGINSGVGQSIYKSLKLSRLKLNILIGDITPISIGLIYPEKFLILPKVEKKNSLKKIIEIIKKKKIDILFIGSEYDLLFFSQNKIIIEKITGAKIAVSDSGIIEKFLDKYKTYQFLKTSKLNYPKTYELKNKKIPKNIKYPIVLKNKFGTSSKQVYVIKNDFEFKNHIKSLNHPILQEFLYKNNDELLEYTCSFFKTKEKKNNWTFFR